MADKPAKGKGEGNPKFLIGGLVCIVLAISWGAYEMLRPRTEDEMKEIKEAEKLRKEIERANAKKTP